MSEATISSQPRRLIDAFEAVCKHCGQVMYAERIVATLKDEEYVHHREVTGSYRQSCDEFGEPTGPVIPTCLCKGN